MRIKTEDHYKCDGCGKEQVNPLGWSYISPMRGQHSDTDFRSGNEDLCSECYYEVKKFLKDARARGQGALK